MFTIVAYSLQKTPLRDARGMLGTIRRDPEYLDVVVGIILVVLGTLAFEGVLPYSALKQGVFFALGSFSLVPAFIKMINDVATTCRKI